MSRFHIPPLHPRRDDGGGDDDNARRNDDPARRDREHAHAHGHGHAYEHDEYPKAVHQPVPRFSAPKWRKSRHPRNRKGEYL